MHEAGHAVASIVVGRPKLLYVDLKQRDMGEFTSVGKTSTEPIRGADIVGMGGDFVVPYVAQILAGPMAEELINPLVRANGAHNQDMKDSFKLIAAAVCEHTKDGDRYQIDPDQQRARQPEFEALFDRACNMANLIISQHLGAITEVANTLIARRELSGAEVEAIVHKHRDRDKDAPPGPCD